MSLVKAERVIVNFGNGIKLEGYRLPNGEFRVGKTSASLALGYGKDWVRRIIEGVAKKEGKTSKTLIEWGFSGVAFSVHVPSSNNFGYIKADTISLQDFRQLIKLAAKRGKPEAEAFLDALIDIGLEDWFRLSFGEDQLSLQEKRSMFYKVYAQSLNWHEEDQEDWKLIREQELFLDEN